MARRGVPSLKGNGNGKDRLYRTGHHGRADGGHLLDAGYAVVASDHRGKPPADVLAKGLKTVSGHAAVAEAADIIITMVPDTPQVADVLFGENGVAEGLPKESS